MDIHCRDKSVSQLVCQSFALAVLLADRIQTLIRAGLFGVKLLHSFVTAPDRFFVVRNFSIGNCFLPEIFFSGDAAGYPFLHLYGFGGDLRPGSIQFVRCPVRPFNVLAKGRVSAFLVGKLQTGGWTLPGLASFPDSIRILFGSFPFPVPGMDMGSFFDRCFRKRSRGLPVL